MSDKKDIKKEKRNIVLQVVVTQDEFETLTNKRGSLSMSSYLRMKGLE